MGNSLKKMTGCFANSVKDLEEEVIAPNTSPPPEITNDSEERIGDDLVKPEIIPRASIRINPKKRMSQALLAAVNSPGSEML